jgi:hypothetical protein
MLRRSILIVGFIIFVVALANAATEDTAGRAASVGEQILNDESLFRKEFRASLNRDLLRSDSFKTVYLVPEGERPRIRKLLKKYGKPDIVMSEEATNSVSDLNSGIEGEGSTRRLTIYYYGKIGFGVESDRAKGVVVLITNWVTPDISGHEASKGTTDLQNSGDIYDGGWTGSSGIGPLSFTVANDAITVVRVEFMAGGPGCTVRGFTMITYNRPLAINGNSFVASSSGGDINFTLEGRFNSNSSASGTLIFTDNRCAGRISTPWSAVNQQPQDFSVSINPGSQTITPGTSTSFTLRAPGLATRSVNVRAAATPPNGNITLSLSSNVIQPRAGETLTVNTTQNTPAGTFTITATGTVGQAVRSSSISVKVIDFALAVNPAVQTIAVGRSANFAVNVQSLGGFTEPVTLSAVVTPADGNVSASLSSSTVTPGGDTNLIINTSPNTSAMPFTITITGRSGQLVRTANATVNIERPDFALNISPGSQSLRSGESTTFTINTQAISGFTDPINLNVAVSPSDNNIRATLSSNTLTPGSNATLTVAAAAITPTSGFTISVTGTSGQLARTTTAMLNVVSPDFSLLFNPATISVTRGQKGQITISINRTEGFSGSVTVTAPDTKALKIKLTPPMQSTTGASASFNFKIKNKTPTGSQTLVFTGRDELGRMRTGTLTLVVQ